MYGFISGLSILYYWSACLSSCQYHTFDYHSIAVSFDIRKYVSSNFVPSPLKFLMNFRISLSISTKKKSWSLIRVTTNMHINLGNIAILIKLSSNPWRWDIFPFIQECLFNFFLQYFVILRVLALHRINWFLSTLSSFLKL